MIGLLQRVTHAQVAVDGMVIAEVGRGVLALIGVEAGDGAREADRLLERMLGYRLFPLFEHLAAAARAGYPQVACGCLLFKEIDSGASH